MKNSAILDRISKSLGMDDIDKKIASLPLKDLQSLLLFIFEEKCKKWSIREMFNQYSTSRFTGISTIEQRKLARLDELLYSLLPSGYETVEFSPVMPFGTSSLLASTDQKNVMSTVRNLEVVADPTTALAIECAKRRATSINKDSIVNLATSHRCIRLQNFEKTPGFIPHFRIFALASSTKNKKPFEFEIEMLLSHMKYYLGLLRILPSVIDCKIKDVSVLISNIGIAEYLMKKHKLNRYEIGKLTQDPSFNLFEQIGSDARPILSSLSHDNHIGIKGLEIDPYLKHLKILNEKIVSEIIPLYPETTVGYDLGRVAGMGYYENLCLRITAKNQCGEILPLVDGGSTNWLKKILESKKERFFISGIGTEFLLQRFCL